ncbi:MAG: type II secretion system protein [Candidatus Omnitrophota bacterium]
MNKQRFGFTLVEMMVVVAILLVILSIGIPNLLRSRTTASEGMAVSGLRAINNACQLFLNNNQAYPGGLADLIPPNSTPPYIDTELASGRRQNYNFFYSQTDSGFIINANPINNVGNPRYFFMDQSGIVRFKEGGPASAADPIFS